MPDLNGWETIAAKLTSLYGDPEPKHWGVIQRYSEGGRPIIPSGVYLGPSLKR